MEIVLAAIAALVYGMGDFCGGRAARVTDSFRVTFVGQIFSLVLLGGALIVLADPLPGAHDWLWGAAGGIGGFIGLSMFYYALSQGSMTVVAPLTAVISSVLPVGVGLGIGERPSGIAYLGIFAAIIGIGLVTGAVGVAHAPTKLSVAMIAVVAGCGFGWMFVCLDRTSDDSGMWPLLGARMASIALAGAVIFLRHKRGTPLQRVPILGLLAGLFDMAANVLFLVASRHGLLSLVSVITSMYPVSTIILAMRLDKEKITRSQITGMVLSGLALALVASGR